MLDGTGARRTNRRFAAGGLVLTVLLGPIGCQAPRLVSPLPSQAASPLASPVAAAQPSGPAVLGIDWGRAASVERPTNYLETVPPTYDGTHPILRINGQAMMVDVAAGPAGGFVAVGYAPPDWTPVAWTSGDGQTWTIHPIGTTAFTFPVAVATGAGGRTVAVGRSGSAPLAWTSIDGVRWEARAVPVLGGGTVAERMTAVVANGPGFVAGGSVGPELLERHARFWSSGDGIAWTPVPDDAATFADSEVRAITTFAAGYVAVGVTGSAQQPTGAVAWTSPDGVAWTRVDDRAFDGGVAVAVVAAPTAGLVAVGSDVGRREAVAWTSSDGRHWSRAPREAARQHSGGYAWMTDVTAIGSQVLAIGEVQGLQRGTAMSWVSSDGVAWEPARPAPVQEQGEFYAVTPGGPGAIAVGSFGAPDSYVPTVWLTPAR